MQGNRLADSSPDKAPAILLAALAAFCLDGGAQPESGTERSLAALGAGADAVFPQDEGAAFDCENAEAPVYWLGGKA